MSNSAPMIRLRGVRHNNLKNFDLDLPTGKLIVFTGLSGSGKSSLAFDTLYAEGQRRYIETFSPYARQFFDRMDKPQVDKIEGIPPAIAIEQRNSVKSTRSTVGTMTEICDYMKVLWPHLAQLYCRQCGQLVQKDSPQHIWEALCADRTREAGRGGLQSEILITFDLPLSEKLPLAESLALVAKQGYQRLLAPSEDASVAHVAFALRDLASVPAAAGFAEARAPVEMVRLDEAAERLRGVRLSALTIVQDRVRLTRENRARFIEACEQAYHFGKGRLAVCEITSEPTNYNAPTSSFSVPRFFSRAFHCAACDLEYREPSPALFSFNNPVGACPACRGFGRTITIDYNLAIPDRSLSLADGAVKPWQSGMSAECQDDLVKFCRRQGIPMNVPFNCLSPEHQRWVIEGDPDYGKDEEHQWPRAWYGVKGYFRWLESKAYKMHVRVLLSRYRAYRECPDCGGKRLKPEALQYRINLRTSPSGSVAASQISLSDFYALSVSHALGVVEQTTATRPLRNNDPLVLALNEVRSRLRYLEEVGLGYLTLDRPTRSLSGGETERVNLTTCLGSRLVNTLFVLDEPSVGLHARDTQRLVHVLQRLRDAGNTVVVVEHEAAVIRAADEIVDLGPGHGEAGGEVVFQGPFKEILKSPQSLTGRYLSGRARIEIPRRRPVSAQTPKLILRRASLHNLKNLTVELPLGRLVCVTGVSGSGKTTLIRDVLVPLLNSKLKAQSAIHSPAGARVENSEPAGTDEDSEANSDTPGAGLDSTLDGWQSLGRVVLVDQSALGRTPRSNPAVYTGAFEDVRELFAQSDLAKQRALNASAFSFNSAQGQCETCRGAGFEKIEMQFLSDVFIRCPDCEGRRYREHILEVKIQSPKSKALSREKSAGLPHFKPGTLQAGWSIADLLGATVDEAVEFLRGFDEARPARRAGEKLKLLQEVGLGYLRLGQPINTLSGGESQRLKLVSHLVEFQEAETSAQKPTLFLFDEPTTGLHFDDVRVLLQVFQRLVEAGHSVLIIEHNLDVIKGADWLIDLGPEAGEAGGRIVATGTPEDVSACAESHTGAALRETR